MSNAVQKLAFLPFSLTFSPFFLLHIPNFSLPLFIFFPPNDIGGKSPPPGVKVFSSIWTPGPSHEGKGEGRNEGMGKVIVM